MSSLYIKSSRGVYWDFDSLGIREYRVVFFKPYRIIYRVMEKNVYVLLIAVIPPCSDLRSSIRYNRIRDMTGESIPSKEFYITEVKS